MTGAALLLLVSGPQALAEDEAAARAPLPPLLRGAPAEAGEREVPDPAPTRNQLVSHPPAIGFDRPKSRLSEKKPHPRSTSYLGISVAKKREAVERHRNRSKDAVARRQGSRTVASEKRQERDRSPAEPGIGSLSTSRDYPNPPIESGTQPPAEPRQAPPLYYPNYFAGPPAYGYAPRYPYAWAPPGAGVLR
jgi:hypothetical protein